jgi:hypothetical protein
MQRQSLGVTFAWPASERETALRRVVCRRLARYLEIAAPRLLVLAVLLLLVLLLLLLLLLLRQDANAAGFMTKKGSLMSIVTS